MKNLLTAAIIIAVLALGVSTWSLVTNLGRDGIQGEQGIRGTPGTNGLNGVNGIDGINGRDGIDGLNGKDGVNGMNGRDGSQGIQGLMGIGATGATGAQGIAGTSVEYRAGTGVFDSAGTCVVVFSTPLSTTDYSVAILGNDTYTISDQTVAGFTVTSHCTPFTWLAIVNK
jgi:hypothetical protein